MKTFIAASISQIMILLCACSNNFSESTKQNQTPKPAFSEDLSQCPLKDDLGTEPQKDSVNGKHEDDDDDHDKNENGEHQDDRDKDEIDQTDDSDEDNDDKNEHEDESDDENENEKGKNDEKGDAKKTSC